MGSMGGGCWDHPLNAKSPAFARVLTGGHGADKQPNALVWPAEYFSYDSAGVHTYVVCVAYCLFSSELMNEYLCNILQLIYDYYCPRYDVVLEKPAACVRRPFIRFANVLIVPLSIYTYLCVVAQSPVENVLHTRVRDVATRCGALDQDQGLPPHGSDRRRD